MSVIYLFILVLTVNNVEPTPELFLVVWSLVIAGAILLLFSHVRRKPRGVGPIDVVDPGY